MSELGNSLVLWPLVLVFLQPDPVVRVTYVPNPIACIPFQGIIRKGLLILGERHAIISLIDPGPFRVFDITARDCLLDEFRQFPYAIILRRITNIKGLVVHLFTWRSERSDTRTSNVFDMDYWPPR